MEIIQGFPPNIEKIRASVAPKPETVFAYGDKIYIQDNKELSPDILMHEGIHQLQQGDDPEAWWDKYLADPIFRLNQELQAYQAQYRYFKQNVKGAKLHAFVLYRLALDLSGETYGNLLSLGEAMSKIRRV